jgi:hypothetical protein
MFHSIAGKTECDDLMDRSAQAILFDIIKSVGKISPQLPAKSVLWREYEVGMVPVFVQRLHSASCNREMPALDKRHIRSDHSDSFLFCHLKCSLGENFLSVVQIV